MSLTRLCCSCFVLCNLLVAAAIRVAFVLGPRVAAVRALEVLDVTHAWLVVGVYVTSDLVDDAPSFLGDVSDGSWSSAVSPINLDSHFNFVPVCDFHRILRMVAAAKPVM